MQHHSIMSRCDANLGVLIGMIITDGSISRKGSSWKIEFTGKSEILHQMFRDLVRKIFKIHNFTETVDSRFPEIKRTMFTSKKVGEILHAIIPKEKIVELPPFIFRLSREEISKILQVMFSCDGNVSLWVIWNKKKEVWEIKKWVKFASKSKKLRFQVKALLNKFGIESLERERNEELLIVKRDSIKKFGKMIRFVEGVEVTKNSKNWCGFEKNQILDLAIKTFEFKKETLRQFNSKEEIFLFLKSMLKTSSKDTLDCMQPRVQVSTGQRGTLAG